MKTGASRQLPLGREKSCLQLVRERLYDFELFAKEYVHPFNSSVGICRVVTEIITPFTYTKIQRDIIDASSSPSSVLAPGERSGR
jgi:hypothetical protein